MSVKNIFFIILLLVNIGVAYLITTLLNIKNIILFESVTATNQIITYEVIIWFILTFIEAIIFEHKKRGTDN